MGSVTLDLSAPSVSDVGCMNPGVAGMAESLEVALVMCSTLSKRFDVVDVLRWRVASFGKTHLAERMLGCISCSDNSPC